MRKHDIAPIFDVESAAFLRPPEIVREDATSADIRTHLVSKADMPGIFSKATWLCCKAAWPHYDPSYVGSKFISLAIYADHEFIGVTGPNSLERLQVTPGTLFVTDPRGMHWLRPNRVDNPVGGFVCLQWEVPDDNFLAYYVNIVHGIKELIPMIGNTDVWRDEVYMSDENPRLCDPGFYEP